MNTLTPMTEKPMSKPIELLLVDDDEMTLFIHEKILKRSGVPFPMRSFQSAEQCLDHLHTSQNAHRYVILLDINMPGMSGWEMLDQMQTELHELEIYVIMATSSVDYDDRKKADHYPLVIDFIEKPFSIDICNGLMNIPELAALK